MSKDYKDTLMLPHTEFPMKANLVKKEPEILEFWNEHAIYEKMEGNNRLKGRYILHDGPPYANGHIHLGTALNKILKDIIIKYRFMKGEYAPYIPGWDCHGLPIELQVDKNLGSKKQDVGIVEKRKLCREYAFKFLDIQREEFKRLGVFADWDNPYVTMEYKYESYILDEFYKFLKSGRVYKGKKPVHWCPSCVTALAEAEVEYQDKESPSVYVKFKVGGEDSVRLGMSGALYIVIWTTTPWTLPANLALAVSAEVDYAFIEVAGEVLIVAELLLNKLAETIKLEGRVVKKLSGAELVGIMALHPFMDRQSKVVEAEFVSVEDGTGVVHIAPGHGEDDYEVGQRNGLAVLSPVDDKGVLTKEAAPFDGMFVFKANEPIIQTLRERNALIERKDVRHSYPHCWRCKKPVIFRATEQWFISMEEGRLKERCIEEIEKVRWVPSWGRDRIYGMVKVRPDWCISRQRAWGVPIAVFTCKGCGEVVRDEAVLQEVVRRFAERGADVWFEEGGEPLLAPSYRCARCGVNEFVKEKDILDVWFDSGVSHAAVLEKNPLLGWPAQLYLEGSDQHRGWFQSSLLSATGTRGRSPYETVLTHGFVVDGKGKKMSKSLGNVIAPQDITGKSGAETVRLWVCAEDYKNDIRISNEILQRLVEAYRKIRNTCRFLLGNIHDYDGGDYSSYLLDIDKWAMSRLSNLIIKTTKSYESFDFHEVFHALYNFCVVDMSSFYLDILKDRVYTFGADSKERRAAQWTMKEILSAMVRIMAPVLSFTAEEVWQSERSAYDASGAHKVDNSFSSESVFLCEFPQVREEFLDLELERKWASLIKIRDVVNKALELRRQDKFIGNSLEAAVMLYADNVYYSLINDYSGFLPSLFIVSKAKVLQMAEFESVSDRAGGFESDELKGLIVVVTKAEGQKCQRCWNVSESVGSFSEADDICDRCYSVVFNKTI
ncbi:MAG: isoleucine--tRNA ligase [Candidatus Magnetoovum sp. WYHC-5]|nr:isoleucine--tRNA ligase [Candidatus Magnetoovum sp. WYHC-5]